YLSSLFAIIMKSKHLCFETTYVCCLGEKCAAIVLDNAPLLTTVKTLSNRRFRKVIGYRGTQCLVFHYKTKGSAPCFGLGSLGIQYNTTYKVLVLPLHHVSV